MRFFTQTWRQADSPDSGLVFAAYEAHLARIENDLPASAREFERTHTLHDAELKLAEADFATSTLVLNLDGWDSALQIPQQYVLRFGAMRTFEQHLPPDDYVESELGDLVYWEWDRLDGMFELRLLFVTGAELRIVAGTFEFEAVPRKRVSRK